MSLSAWIVMIGMLGLFWGGFAGLLWMVLRRQGRQRATEAPTRGRSQQDEPPGDRSGDRSPHRARDSSPRDSRPRGSRPPPSDA